MDWLKKKKAQATAAANQAAAKLQNKRTTTFRGEGNVLGDGTGAVPRPIATASAPRRQLPFASEKPPVLTDEEKERRRAMQTQAAEARATAWDRRVAGKRQVRKDQECSRDDQTLAGPPPTSSLTEDSKQVAMPPAPTAVLSEAEVKRREVELAQAQLGFNPYAVTFSSSTEATAVINPMGARTLEQDRDLERVTTSMAQMSAGGAVEGVEESGELEAESAAGHAIYVLLRQEPRRAITATETILKILQNALAHPQEEKFRRVRLANTAIQTKLVNVTGAIDLLIEAGFIRQSLDGKDVLILPAADNTAKTLQAAVDRTEVALVQLKHDAENDAT